MRGETDRRRPAEKVGPGDVKENTSDDLTVIRGIGRDQIRDLFVRYAVIGYESRYDLCDLA
jgi:hypothetical protein